MKRISPVWILTTLEGDAFEKFKVAIDQQFKAFSENELDGFVDCETHRWWGVETTHGGLDDKWNQQTGYPQNIPAYLPPNFGLYDGQQGIVIYYASLPDFTKDVNKIVCLKNNPSFFHTYNGNKFFYGLISFSKGEKCNEDFLELVKTIERDENDNKLFDSITFLSNSNHSAEDNKNGYWELNEDDFRSLVVNVIFTIAITKRSLYNLNNAQQRLFNTAGVFSFIYEPESLKKSKAYNLSEQLLDTFTNNMKDSEWYSENDAKTHFDTSTLKKNLHWYNIYKLLGQGFEEESLKGLCTNVEISPWRMFAYKLVPIYFKKYVKYVLRNTYDNVHDYSALTVMRYESYAQNRYIQILDGTAEIENKKQFTKNAVADYLSSIWSEDYHGAKGIKQVQNLLKKTKEYFVKQKEEVARIRTFNPPNDDDHKIFPKIDEYPLFEIDKKENKKYKKQYEEYVTNGQMGAANTEEDRISTLHKLLQWHAMPLNLFTKAALLSVLVFVTVWASISIFQASHLVNIFTLDTDLSLVILFVATMVLVLVFAFVRYGVKTIRKIKLILRKYIAWSYYRVQREVYEISLDKEERYYDELINECDRIKGNLDNFVESKVKNKPAFEKYKISKFQRNIMDNMDDGRPILKNTALNVKLEINDKEFSLENVESGLFDAMLKESNINDLKLDERMRDCVMMERDDDCSNLKECLLKIWSETLADNIQLLINGQYGDSVDFPAFHNNPNSNFTSETMMSVGTIFYPSVVYNMTPFSCGVSIVPNGVGHVSGSNWENLFYRDGYGAVDCKIPNFADVKDPAGWLTTKQIAIFMRIHAYDKLIVNDSNNKETTIF